MTLVTRIHMEIRGGPDQMRRDWPRIRQEALAELGEWWHQEYMPLKFEPFAGALYGYAPRTYAYRQRKQRVMGHDRPLVWSGTLKHDVLAWAEIQSTADGANIVMRSNVLNLVGRRLGDPSYPDIGAELTSVAPAEPQRFAEWLDAVATQKMEALDEVTQY